jgi:hypothetical protein
MLLHVTILYLLFRDFLLQLLNLLLIAIYIGSIFSVFDLLIDFISRHLPLQLGVNVFDAQENLQFLDISSGKVNVDHLALGQLAQNFLKVAPKRSLKLQQ